MTHSFQYLGLFLRKSLSYLRLALNNLFSSILDSFFAFHSEISNLAELFFKNNWIDASLRKGKASGAFAHPSVPSLHPYILVNYQGKIRSKHLY